MIIKNTILELYVHKYDNTRIGFFIDGARISRYHYKQWFRYLRKAVDNGSNPLTEEEVAIIIENGDLTMYQKITLKRAMEPGTPTNLYVKSLNERAKTPILDEVLRKRNHAR